VNPILVTATVVSLAMLAVDTAVGGTFVMLTGFVVVGVVLLLDVLAWWVSTPSKKSYTDVPTWTATDDYLKRYGGGGLRPSERNGRR
jgi:hypothetical protein